MSGKLATLKISGTSPAAAGQAVVGKAIGGLEEYDDFVICAQLVGATGGVLDVYLQRKIDTDVWVDWAHFTQLTNGNAAVKYVVAALPPATSAPVAVGVTKDDGTTGAPALAANAIVAGHPGGNVRCVCVAGAGTSAGALVDIRIMAHRTNF